MKSRAVFLGLILLLSFTPAYSRVRDQPVDFADSGTPPGGASTVGLLVAVVMAHADNMLPEDEFIEVDGRSVKKSNYQGLVSGDRTYYYCLAPHLCSCPVCRGTAELVAVRLFYLDESADSPMAIYTLEESAVSATDIHTLIRHQDDRAGR